MEFPREFPRPFTPEVVAFASSLDAQFQAAGICGRWTMEVHYAEDGAPAVVKFTTPQYEIRLTGQKKKP